uniref:UPF0057 membrane protein n=1 Tax=Solanum tuberosum TaxID=4113 RepID=M1ARY5_SOLTU
MPKQQIVTYIERLRAKKCEFLVCLILTLLGYIPGIIYAIYAIVVRGYDQDEEWRPLTA